MGDLHTAVHCFQHTADLVKPMDKLAHAGDNHVVRHMHQRLVPALALQLLRCKSAAAATCPLPAHISLVQRHNEHCCTPAGADARLQAALRVTQAWKRTSSCPPPSC